MPKEVEEAADMLWTGWAPSRCVRRRTERGGHVVCTSTTPYARSRGECPRSCMSSSQAAPGQQQATFISLAEDVVGTDPAEKSLVVEATHEPLQNRCSASQGQGHERSEDENYPGVALFCKVEEVTVFFISRLEGSRRVRGDGPRGEGSLTKHNFKIIWETQTNIPKTTPTC